MILGSAFASSRFCNALEPTIGQVVAQPYFAAANRSIQSLARLGSPIRSADAEQIAVLTQQNDPQAVSKAEEILSRYTLAKLSLGPNGAPQIAIGEAPRQLVEQGWRVFLVRVENPSGQKGSLVFTSGTRTIGNLEIVSKGAAQRTALADALYKGPMIEEMWLATELYEPTPILSGGVAVATIPLPEIPIEYHIVQLFSRDHGPRTTSFFLNVLMGSNDHAFHPAHRQFDFECLPSHEIPLRILDTNGNGCVASLTIKDKLNRVYPPKAMRLAPDLFFQEQVYRADGETVRLTEGEYLVKSERGPEYLCGTKAVQIRGAASVIDVKLERWIDPSKWGFYSGDTHIHAAGCSHYERPTEGVGPETLIRHIRGEALTIGDALNWGPSWYYQKQFFSGNAESPVAALEHPELQKAYGVTLQPQTTREDVESIIRYDVEVSQFPSSHAGHLVLLQLKEQDYPGAQLIEDWPSWNLPILKWVKAQGAYGGYAHCGLGMVVDSTDLPNYEIPPMDGIGTQEAIIDVTHGCVDFLSGCDSLPVAELNAWYHMLNCGFRMAMVGETDFPCMSDGRVGAGRSYVKLGTRPNGNSGYTAWIEGLFKPHQYCGDGRSHVLECKVNGQPLSDSDLVLESGETINVEVLIAARLEPELTPETKARRANESGYDIERARIGNTRQVPLELIVNGLPAAIINIVADGVPRAVALKAKISRSSWWALRVLPSLHTHPSFVRVNNKPVRASKKSAEWCRACVDKVWEVKSPFMRESEHPAAATAFEHARKTYEQIASECEVV
ncbi:CehA/McbA family metallohydrolase [Terriglobus roseus]|uniref:CehA/McbA family metallohydrolase n=1 Tax=Terriglobus roseus TaxID=392734 RepID=UPI0012EAAF54|nr:CehA/McbA family metallohydrolase [Terriglobus roseus]